MKAVVFTLGCKVNACESASLMTGLKSLGFEAVETYSWKNLDIDKVKKSGVFDERRHGQSKY